MKLYNYIKSQFNKLKEDKKTKKESEIINDLKFKYNEMLRECASLNSKLMQDEIDLEVYIISKRNEIQYNKNRLKEMTEKIKEISEDYLSKQRTFFNLGDIDVLPSVTSGNKIKEDVKPTIETDYSEYKVVDKTTPTDVSYKNAVKVWYDGENK